ncbi:GumC family protein [Paracoccus zhejiangensis]|uniref:Lipopolysaccharide biosynthesis protein n=1 Tax=Paracoccus zhejiangensis TaxID=1077935 RepID=A0A2H5EWZ7_9RHOB|nr:Wzz/FepE/Etk N-terminal domain-containing protein [Paracoccus zhejiangensis]AUH63825.1 lipopolysaccharide biosynthesis protein [Paracoccus zhejiangensis]
MGPIQSIADLVSLIWRRLPLILTVLLAGLLLSLYLAVTSPSAFEARTVIQVDAPVIFDPVTRSAPPAALRVQQIEQRLMSRENLLRLIDQYGLFDGAERMPESAKLEVMRAQTRIESVASSAVGPENTGNLAALVISARAGTAQTAADLTNDLANDVVTSYRREREARINESHEFLTTELKRIEADLDGRDRAIAAYASENEDSLPEARTFHQQELVGLTQRQTLTEQSLMQLRRERLALERTEMTDETSSIVQQLRATEVALAQARRTLPSGHPEIRRLEETVRAITDGRSEDTPAGLSRQLSMIDEQVANMEADLDMIAARRDSIATAQNRMPQVAQIYEQMQRSRQNLSDQYTEMSRRLAEIDALRLLADNDQTENMVILEPAIPPEFPVASNRKRSAILGTFLSIAVSSGLALLLDLMNPVLRNARQFEAVTGLRPLVALGYRPTARDRTWFALRMAYVGVLLLAALVAVLWMIDLMPEWLAQMLPPSVRVGVPAT